MVERLFLAVPRGCLRFVIVVFPDHTHLLFLSSFKMKIILNQMPIYNYVINISLINLFNYELYYERFIIHIHLLMERLQSNY